MSEPNAARTVIRFLIGLVMVSMVAGIAATSLLLAATGGCQ